MGDRSLLVVVKWVNKMPTNDTCFACRPLWYSGLLLIASGLFHVLIWLLDGTDWVGNVSWRKPILFGISTGLTLCSLGWLAGRLKVHPADRSIGWSVAISLVCEVALITLQQWRGQASHFNRLTTLDAWVDGAMMVLIIIAFVGICYYCIRSFGTLNLSLDYALAARAGMIFLVLSCVIGFAISFHGYARIAAGFAAETVGQRGVAKFPHGVAIHALQILPATVLLLQSLKMTETTRLRAVNSQIISFALFLLFASHQTVNGLGRFEIATTVGWCLAVAAILTATYPLTLVLWEGRHKLARLNNMAL